MTILLLCGIVAFHPDTHRAIRVCVPAEMIRHRRLMGDTRRSGIA